MIEVWTYSGYRGDERPVRFILNGIVHQVDEVIDRWYGQEADYYKVKTSNGRIYILKQDRFDGMWDLESVAR